MKRRHREKQLPRKIIDPTLDSSPNNELNLDLWTWYLGQKFSTTQNLDKSNATHSGSKLPMFHLGQHSFTYNATYYNQEQDLQNNIDGNYPYYYYERRVMRGISNVDQGKEVHGKLIRYDSKRREITLDIEKPRCNPLDVQNCRICRYTTFGYYYWEGTSKGTQRRTSKSSMFSIILPLDNDGLNIIQHPNIATISHEWYSYVMQHINTWAPNHMIWIPTSPLLSIIMTYLQ
jgi:hypothetical protein